MKFALLVVVSLLVVGVADGNAASHQAPCLYGRVQSFASIRANPPYLVGTIPSRFTGKHSYFSRRYNCKKQGVLVRRVDLGVYDVRFPGLRYRTAVVSAISQEGVTASVYAWDNATYRVVLRGPLSDNNALIRRDVPFSIATY